MSHPLQSCDFHARVERLKANSRGKQDSLDSSTYVYHRLPSELFYEGRLIEDAVKTPGVRSPEQSVTLGIEEYDHIDALIRFLDGQGDKPTFLGGEFGVVYWTVHFLQKLNHTTKHSNSSEVSTYCLHVIHTPYPYHYAHGNIRSMINCCLGKWKNKEAKSFLREIMTREIADKNQIAALPGQYELIHADGS
jgi:hypothetical protein